MNCRLDTSQVDYSRIASADSDRFSVAIATVFDHGPWVHMCQYLGMPAVSGTLYGAVMALTTVMIDGCSLMEILS